MLVIQLQPLIREGRDAGGATRGRSSTVSIGTFTGQAHEKPQTVLVNFSVDEATLVRATQERLNRI